MARGQHGGAQRRVRVRTVAFDQLVLEHFNSLMRTIVKVHTG